MGKPTNSGSLDGRPSSEDRAFGPQSSPSSSGSASDSDSDSLDSSSPRKRRRGSPSLVEGTVDGDVYDDDDDEGVAAPIPTAAVPSRIKSKTKTQHESETIAIESALNDLKQRNRKGKGGISAPTDPHTTFTSLKVHKWLVGSLTSMAIKRPTGIQKGCIPEILAGRDCIGGSRTGSGKTVAFAVPILQIWAEDPFGIFAIVLTPTRYAVSSL